MCAVGGRVQPDGLHPTMHNPRVVPRGKMGPVPQPAGKQVVVRLEIGLGDPDPDSIPGLLGHFELNRALGLLLHDDGPREQLIAMGNVANTQVDQVTAA